MKKFFKDITLFALFALVVYTVLVVIWESNAPFVAFSKNVNYRMGGNGNMYTRLNEVRDYKDVDLLFLGASQSYRSFDPAFFEEQGLSNFNLGSSAQTPIQTNFLLNQYLDSLNPKAVVYTVYPGNFASDGLESTLDLIANQKLGKASLNMAAKHLHIKVLNNLIYAFYNDVVMDRKSVYVEPIVKGDDTYRSGGFVQKAPAYFKHNTYATQEWHFRQDQYEAFEKNLQLLHNRNIKVYLVQVPITPSKYKSYTNNSTFDEKMRTYGNYHNFNKVLALDDSLHFYDAHHLNQDGVVLFDNAVLELLQRN